MYVGMYVGIYVGMYVGLVTYLCGVEEVAQHVDSVLHACGAAIPASCRVGSVVL